MKKLTKKVITLALAMTLSLGMMVSAIAAESPAAGSESPTAGSNSPVAGSESPTTGSESATTGSESATAGTSTITANKVMIDGVEYSVTLSEPSDSVKTEVNSQEKLVSLLGASYVSGSTLEVLGLQEVTLPVAIPAGGVAITFNVDGVKAGDVIKVLHKRSSDGVWEVLDAVVADGTITATFTSLSPVAFVKVTGGNVADATLTSPKTGESNMIYVVEILAALCLAGAFITGKRRLAVR